MTWACWDDECIAKIVMQRKLEGTRRREELRKVWISALEERTGINLHRATELAQDRSKWRKPV